MKFASTHLYTWVERGTVRVLKCLAQEHSTMSPARASTRTARSRVGRTNHEATMSPPTQFPLIARGYMQHHVLEQRRKMWRHEWRSQFYSQNLKSCKIKAWKKIQAFTLSFHFLVRLDLPLLVLHIIVNLLNTAFLLKKSLQYRGYFGTEPSIDQVFDFAILDCCWLGHSAGGNGWVGRVVLSPRPFFHLSHTSSANCPSPQPSRHQIQDGGLIQKCALTWQ